mmetsp:Transcript_5952/g.14129  ORF Transcript_5952/g.14129 Transcript_5952/m.14129 type:complete len:287 (-) Transcript_5952:150-1010(-)
MSFTMMWQESDDLEKTISLNLSASPLLTEGVWNSRGLCDGMRCITCMPTCNFVRVRLGSKEAVSTGGKPAGATCNFAPTLRREALAKRPADLLRLVERACVRLAPPTKCAAPARDALGADALSGGVGEGATPYVGVKSATRAVSACGSSSSDRMRPASKGFTKRASCPRVTSLPHSSQVSANVTVKVLPTPQRAAQRRCGRLEARRAAHARRSDSEHPNVHQVAPRDWLPGCTRSSETTASGFTKDDLCGVVKREGVRIAEPPGMNALPAQAAAKRTQAREAAVIT